MTYVELVGVSSFLLGLALGTTPAVAAEAAAHNAWVWVAFVASLVLFAFVRRE